MARNPDYDYTFNCLDYDRFGVIGKGVLTFSPSLSGNLGSISCVDSTLTLATLTISGTFIQSYPQSGDALDFSTKLAISGDFIPGPGVYARVKWSNIGEFDFEIDRKNVAGEMPLSWRGNVYKILQLGAVVVVYGSGGISKLTPYENFFGEKVISNVGVVSKWSIVGNEDLHFFIDNAHRLCKISARVNDPEYARRSSSMSNNIEVLDYSEFLGQMTDPVLTFDPFNELIYICDGTYGYVYSIEYNSLSVGLPNLTGIGYSNAEFFAVADGDITPTTFKITTSVLDLFTRKNKTIHKVEVGTNLTEDLEVNIEYNLNIHDSFTSIGWYDITQEGARILHCFGKEFKVSLRCQDQDNFKLDWLRIHGIIHDYNPLDS